MGKLSILGAQRVKALQEILELQKKAELAKAVNKYPESSEVLAELEKDYPGITVAAELVTTVFGTAPRRSYNSAPFDKTYNALTVSNQAERDTITARYDDKARQLWLCETLEEAKEIVYGPQTITKEASQ